MDYISQLGKEHSRLNSDKIAKAIGNNPSEFKKLVTIIYNEEAPIPQRASWLLAIIDKKHPTLLEPYISKFINSIEKFKIDGIKRNMMFVLSNHKIPAKLQAKLLDVCYNFILSNDETVAVKVHAMQVIADLTKEHPELKSEFKSVIDNQIDKNSQAFAARARLIFKKIKD